MKQKGRFANLLFLIIFSGFLIRIEGLVCIIHESSIFALLRKSPALTCEDGVFFNCQGDPDENHSKHQLHM